MIDLLDVKDIDEYIQKSVNDPSLEMEYIFGSKPKESREILTKDMFMRLLSFCNSNYVKLETITNLDIRSQEIRKGRSKLSDLRITLNDLNSIKEYCKKDEFKENMNIEYIKKTTHFEKDKRNSLQNEDYNYRINLKTEQELGDASPETLDILDDWKNKKKFFRYKRRISFITNDKLFRIDITAVKNNSFNKSINNYNLYKSFKESKVLNEPEQYELEIEYIGNMKINGTLNIQNYIQNREKLVNVLDDNIYTSPTLIGITESINTISKLSESDNIQDILNDIDTDNLKDIKVLFNKVIYNIHVFIYDTKLIMKESEKDKVLKEYYKLTNQTKRRKVFMAPQPVTLNFNGLNIESGGNIISNYVVTEKADGERYMLYINEDKKGYLINNKLDVKNIGIQFPTVNGEWLIDGEYITKDKNNEAINLYMIFDVYYATNETDKPVYKYPFISKKESRSEILEIFKIHVSESVSDSKEDLMRIDFKLYEKGATKIEPQTSAKFKNNYKILAQSKNILKRSEKNGYEYKIDGLIFLPTNLPVKAGLDGKVPQNIGGTWDYNYKWKPPEENTIDFQVIIKKNKKGRDEVFSYIIHDDDGTDIVKEYKKLILKVLYDEKQDTSLNFCFKMLEGMPKTSNNIETAKFKPPNMWGDIGETNILLQDGKILCENEGNEIKDEIKDKDIVEMRYNSEAENDMIWEPLRIRRDKTKPQFFLAANNIWETITNPITTNMISGQIDLKDINKNISLENIDDYYVAEESTYISEPLRKLHNFIKSKLIGSIGSSQELPSSKQIMDTSIGRGGDIQKYMNPEINCKFLFGLDIAPVDEACRRYYYDRKRNKAAVFIRYDTSKNIKTKGGFLEFNNEFSETMINILYDMKEKIPKEYKNINKRFNGKANDKFNIISSQFTIHYYFIDEETLKGYLTNIQQNTKKGGFFIGTCYNGLKIFNELEKPEPFEYIDTLGNLIYRVEKKYKTKDFKYKGDRKDMLGQEINVYMESIGQDIPEYLVNFDYFIDIMKQYGFEPYKPKMKTKYNKVIKNDIGSFLDIIKELDTIQKDDIELNRYYKQSLDILKDPALIKLSSMNNYFIFQKK